MAATTRRTKKTATAKPKVEATIVEDEELEELDDADVNTDEDEDADLEADDELEELDEDEVATEKPAGKKKAAGRDANITFGIRDLVTHIKTETGKDTDPRAIRTLIRKMARDESGRVNREIKAGNRERYNWTGPTDPEVVAIIDAFKGGELEAEKKAKLDKLKADKAAKAAAKKAQAEAEGDDEAKPARAAKKTTARKAKPAPVEEVEDDEELDFDEE